MITSLLPKPNYLSRMRIYLAEMYPVPQRILLSALLYFSLATFLRRVNSIDSSIFSHFAGIGIWGLFAVTLLIRLMDEIKDKEIDRKFFAHRPLPSGRVLESDIKFSITLVIALYLAANLWAGPALWMAVLVVGYYALLMFKHFFIPPIARENLVLTFVTHQPSFAVVLLYLFTLFSVENSLTLRDLNWHAAILLTIMYWAMFFAQEIARKIRSQEEETAYVTYSQVLGRLGAVLVAIGAQTLTLAIGLYFYWSLSLSPAFVLILAVGYGTTLWDYTRFLIHPSPATSRLRPVSDRFVVCVLIAQSVEHGLLAGLKGTPWFLL